MRIFPAFGEVESQCVAKAARVVVVRRVAALRPGLEALAVVAILGRLSPLPLYAPIQQLVHKLLVGVVLQAHFSEPAELRRFQRQAFKQLLQLLELGHALGAALAFGLDRQRRLVDLSGKPLEP